MLYQCTLVSLHTLTSCIIGFLYPETTGRTLEDMEALFNKDHSPLETSNEEPDRYSDYHEGEGSIQNEHRFEDSSPDGDTSTTRPCFTTGKG